MKVVGVSRGAFFKALHDEKQRKIFHKNTHKLLEEWLCKPLHLLRVGDEITFRVVEDIKDLGGANA